MTRDQETSKANVALAEMGMQDVAYVRPVLSDDLLDQVPEAAELAPGTQLFALHAANGVPIVVSDTLDGAFAAAWQKSLTPVALH